MFDMLFMQRLVKNCDFLIYREYDSTIRLFGRFDQYGVYPKFSTSASAKDIGLLGRSPCLDSHKFM